MDDAHEARARKLINGGVDFLLAQREKDGGWSMGGGANRPAVTAMVLKALVRHRDLGPDSPVVKRGFEILLKYCRKDGSIYDPRQGLSSYTTAVAIMALKAAGTPGFNEAIRGAADYLKGLQILPGSESPDGRIVGEDSPDIGGFGYGRNGKPNLSVTGMVIEGLHDAGVAPDDAAMRQALVFLSRVQNRSESNPLAFAKKGTNDGGFVYDPGGSKAGRGPGGRGLRSYGSMTYVGFKSMLYAGLARNDPRVRAAFAWIRRYWRLDSNPNMPRVQSEQGLYYYYHVFAKALRAWGQPVIKDAKGVEHNWREELIDALGRRVLENGSWVNNADRWQEGSPVLVTTYCVLALQETLKK